jgi:AcrR family transcriptional regulator
VAGSEVWRGTTAAERSASRRDQLIEAALDILGSDETVTVRGVCARAALNARYFYESFEDVDALVVAVWDQVLAETTELGLLAIAAAENTAEAKTRAALDTSIRYVAGDPRRARVVLEASATHRAIAERRTAAISATAELMAAQAAAFYAIPPDDKLLRGTAIMLTGGLVELVHAWHDGRLAITLDELVDQATAMVLSTTR